MSFQQFVQSAQGLTTAITMLLGVIAAYLTVRKSYFDYLAAMSKHATATTEAGAPDRAAVSPRLLRAQIIISALGGVLLGSAATIFAARLLFAGVTDSKPAVTITQPVSGSTITVHRHPSGSAYFEVTGHSTSVFNDASRRIYLLVHPQQPPAPGWWIQPDVAVDSAGNWSGLAWIGNAQAPVASGHHLWLMAVVAAPRDPVPVDIDGVPWVRAPAVLEPSRTSNVARVTVGAVVVPPEK